MSAGGDDSRGACIGMPYKEKALICGVAGQRFVAVSDLDTKTYGSMWLFNEILRLHISVKDLKNLEVNRSI